MATGTERKALPLGLVLARCRMQRKIARKDLARACGFGETYFARVEGGYRMPSLENFVRICDGLGIEAWRVLRAVQQVQAGKEQR